MMAHLVFKTTPKFGSSREDSLPLTSSERANIIARFWKPHEGHSPDDETYSAFFQYVEDEIHRERHSLLLPQVNTIHHIQDLVEVMKEVPMQKRPRSEITRKALINTKTLSLRSIEEYLGLAVRLWLTINVRSEFLPGPGSFKRPFLWDPDESLIDMIKRRFPADIITLSSKFRVVPEGFTAEDLVRKCNLKLRWTDYLDEHLRVNRETKTVLIYRHKICLQNFLSMGEFCPIPLDILTEALDTLDLLFPSDDSRTRKFLMREGQSSILKLGSNSSLRVLELTRYTYWRKDLEWLLQQFDVHHHTSTPFSLSQLTRWDAMSNGIFSRKKNISQSSSGIKDANSTVERKEHDVPALVSPNSPASKSKENPGMDTPPEVPPETAGHISVARELNPFTTRTLHEAIWINDIAKILLSRKDLETLYKRAFCNIDPREVHAQVWYSIEEYGRNLLDAASNTDIEMSLAKIVQFLAEPITTEISLHIWKQTGQGYSSESPLLDKQAQDEDGNGLELPDEGDPLRTFLLRSKAFNIHVEAMRVWLEAYPDLETGSEKSFRDKSPTPENLSQTLPVDATAKHEATQDYTKSVPSEKGEQKGDESEPSSDEIPIPQQDTEQDPESTSPHGYDHRRIIDLVSSLLSFWGITFFFYDLVELFVPHVPPGYKRLRWRCSCNTVLWGDFAIDEDALNQLKRELSWWSAPHSRQVPSGAAAGSGTNPSGMVPSGATNPASSSSAPGATQPASAGNQQHTNISNASSSGPSNIVNITFPLRYFEICVNVGNFAIDHHELDISRISSDSELFELIWDKYNSSRGKGLRRLFLRPRNVDFVMFSVSRHITYGAGIHKRPDEFPPRKEVDQKRYHFLYPKTRMPANVFLHYLHRARWNIWGEHTEDIWLRRLPKKLNESILDRIQNSMNNPQSIQQATVDPDLAFGWGVHIIDGPNHAALGLLLAIGVGVAFVVSGMVVGIAKTQEQGFGVGSFLVAIFASVMAAVYFKLQDQ